MVATPYEDVRDTADNAHSVILEACVAACCSVLQRVAVYYSVLQCVIFELL